MAVACSNACTCTAARLEASGRETLSDEGRMPVSESERRKSAAYERCLRLVCDMRCLVGVTFAFLAAFVCAIVVGVTSRSLRGDVDPNLSLVVVDTDMGTDDAYALLMLLKAEELYYDKDQGHGPRVAAVTCVNGNTGVDNVVVNVLKILDLAGRLDGSIPVYRGAGKSILKTNAVDDYFGSDGMGDVPGVPAPSLDHVNSTHAAVALVDLVNRHPGQITLLAIGPLTNIALAIRLYPEFLMKLKHLVILGGAVEGRGNIVPGVEFNFWMDPEANYIVLKDTEYYNDTISLLSWEASEDVAITQEWRVKVLGASKSPWMEFLNKAEGISTENTEGTWDFADPVAVALVIRPELAHHQVHAPVVVFTQGEARGGIAVDYYGKLHNATTVRFFRDINQERYKKMLLEYFS